MAKMVDDYILGSMLLMWYNYRDYGEKRKGTLLGRKKSKWLKHTPYNRLILVKSCMIRSKLYVYNDGRTTPR